MKNAKKASPFEVSREGLEQFSDAISQAAKRGQAMIEVGMKSWESEAERYYREFAAHSRETLEALGKCKGPIDVLDVEQKWLQTRARAYFESGQRFAQAFADVARNIPTEFAAARTAVEEQVHKT